MTDNTIDSDLQKALKTIDIVDELIHSITRRHIPDYPEATIAINKIDNLIAQEANKARIDELTKVWGGMNTAGTIRDDGYSARSLNLDDLAYWLHNRRRVLKGEKALTPEEWLEAER